MAGETLNRPRMRLGVPSQGDGTARGGYGRGIFEMDRYTCAYCGLSMLKDFESYLQLSVDHVVPQSTKGYDPVLIEDMANRVTCCRACNEFSNRYRADTPADPTEDTFWELRERVFRERRALILKRREGELERYERIRRFTWPPGEPEAVPEPASGSSRRRETDSGPDGSLPGGSGRDTVQPRGGRVAVDSIRTKTPGQVRAAVGGFSARYVADWDAWLAAPLYARPELFGRTLRKWQATRPLAMRRLRAEAQHGAPFLEDLLESATEPIVMLGDLTVLTVTQRTPQQDGALAALWEVFSRLPTTGLASCVGITKAILLLTDGRIGPAFDAQVRAKLGVGRPATSQAWLQILERIGEDIAAFESVHGPLVAAVPARFAHLAYGRLYDMALGPR